MLGFKEWLKHNKENLVVKNKKSDLSWNSNF